MDWFEKIFHFKEPSSHKALFQRLELIQKAGQYFLKTKGQDSVVQVGTLEIPTLAQLRQKYRQLEQAHPTIPKNTTLHEIVADVQKLHLAQENKGAMFQVASQVNLLEMASPRATPEDGVTIYWYDRTQGPACAIAAGAGTVYRNYFHTFSDGQQGQTAKQQINTLDELHHKLTHLMNEEQSLWQTQNGYVFPSDEQLQKLNHFLTHLNETQLDELRALCKIGFQWDTQVTLAKEDMIHVNQAYCSAMPLGYHRSKPELWEPFARLVLEAAYESVLIGAACRALQGGSRKVFLTTIGGGVFANPDPWIYAAIRRALDLFPEVGLEVYMVSYGTSRQSTQELIHSWTV